MRLLTLAISLLFAIGAQAQPSTLLGVGDKAAVVLAALDFASALKTDSVGVAGCSIEREVGTADYEAVVRVVLEGRIVEPTPRNGEEPRCDVRQLIAPGATRVYAESLVEVRRASSGVIPYPERLAYVLRLQLWRGIDYREWHEVTVRPDRFETTDGELGPVFSWRVIKYEVTGWEWIHEYSRSAGAFR